MNQEGGFTQQMALIIKLGVDYLALHSNAWHAQRMGRDRELYITILPLLTLGSQHKLEQSQCSSNSYWWIKAPKELLRRPRLPTLHLGMSPVLRWGRGGEKSLHLLV